MGINISTKYASDEVEHLLRTYSNIKPLIEKRLEEFRFKRRNLNRDIFFEELVFCLLTPASRATSAWKTLISLKRSGILYWGTREMLAREFNMVRFRNQKASRVVEARHLVYKDFQSIINLFNYYENSKKVREWLVKTIKGFGYKEASHFLRNIGWGEELAILDRHVLRNLFRLKVIDTLPSSLTPGRYLEIEERMKQLSWELAIPVFHLDYLFWYEYAGMIFK